jgi:hypothetical protein
MKPAVLMLMALPMLALAQENEQCVLQNKTVTQNRAVISERSPVRRDIVVLPSGAKKCVVDFRVRVGSRWYTAMGEYSWKGGNRTEHDACTIAVYRAETDVKTRLGGAAVASEQILVCKDRPELKTIKTTRPGEIGDVAQFRPHPNYPNRFWHNGTVCKWFVEPTFDQNDIRQHQGIICEVRPQKWVVVDKF